MICMLHTWLVRVLKRALTRTLKHQGNVVSSSLLGICRLQNIKCVHVILHARKHCASITMSLFQEFPRALKPCVYIAQEFRQATKNPRRGCWTIAVLELLQSNKTTLGSETQDRCSSSVVHAAGDQNISIGREISAASIGLSMRGGANREDASRAGKRTTLSRARCWDLRVLSVTRQTWSSR